MPRLATDVLTASALIALAMGVAATPAGVGLPRGSWRSTDDGARQIVNRGDKQDRLPLPVASRLLPPAAQPSRHILVGCEPVFSPLSAAARLNRSGRCLASMEAQTDDAA